MILLIGGHPRSGTTLLRHLCNSHPEMVITNEFGNFLGLEKPYGDYSRLIVRRLWDKGVMENRQLVWSGINRRWMKVVNILRAHIFAAQYLIKVHEHRRKLIGAQSVEASLRDIFPGKRVIGDKLPDYLFLLDKLAGTAGMSFLIIYRDCRDVTSSVLEKVRTTWRSKPWVNEFNTVEKVAKRWVLAIGQMEHYKDKVHIVRYEDLVHHTERELIALGNWVGVDPAGFSIKMVRNTSVGKYRSGLTDKELATVMEIAGPTMERMGYL